MGRRVLSVDWDYFTSDNQFSEPCKICKWSCWDDIDCHPKDPHTRERNNCALNTDPWDPSAYSFQLVRKAVQTWRPAVKGAPLIVADCHGSIYRYLQNGDVVFNYDTHRDMEGIGVRTSCANWAIKAVNKKGVTYYWNNRNGEVPRGKRVGSDPVDLVFVCQSTPYTAPMLDNHFYGMIALLSRAMGVAPQFVGLGARKMRRAYARRKRVVDRRPKLTLKLHKVEAKHYLTSDSRYSVRRDRKRWTVNDRGSFTVIGRYSTLRAATLMLQCYIKEIGDGDFASEFS